MVESTVDTTVGLLVDQLAGHWAETMGFHWADQTATLTVASKANETVEQTVAA
jgi:hypothetical protein